MWREPICDRTEEDVMQGTPKGYCNAGDLCRLEENCAVVAGLLDLTLTTAAWEMDKLPTCGELTRIGNNLRAIRARYTPYRVTPEAPEGYLTHWQKWNDGERILRDCHRSVADNREARSYCGQAAAGEEIGVI